jgi:hypothetical protein
MLIPYLNDDKTRHETYHNALAIAFALPSTLAFAENPMNLGEPAARPVVRGVAIGTAGPIPTQASEQHLREYSCSYLA